MSSGAHDPGLDPAGGDFAAQPLGRRGGGVETNKLAPGRFERRRDAVKAVDQRNLGFPPLTRTIAGAQARERLLRIGRPAFSSARRRRAGGLRDPKEGGLGRRSRLRVIGWNAPCAWSKRRRSAATTRPRSHRKRRSQPARARGSANPKAKRPLTRCHGNGFSLRV